MRKHLLLLFLSVMTTTIFAQSNLIVFAENGESIYLTVDGSDAENLNDSKVKFEGIKADFVQVRITFKENSDWQIKKTVMIEPNSEITLVLKENKKGVHVLRPVSTVPISSVASNERPYPVVLTEQVDVVKVGEPQKNTPAATVEEVVTTTTTTTSESSPTSINVGVGGGGVKMDVNIDVSDSGMLNTGVGVSSTSSTTVTTTTTTSSSSSQNYSETTVAKEPVVTKEIVCGPMLDSDYNTAKNSISKKAFADDKMILAKQIVKANCVSTNQIIGIMDLFDFEDNKVEFAKHAYDRVSDPQNYFMVNDAFTYSSSIDELNEFLDGR